MRRRSCGPRGSVVPSASSNSASPPTRHALAPRLLVDGTQARLERVDARHDPDHSRRVVGRDGRQAADECFELSFWLDFNTVRSRDHGHRRVLAGRSREHVRIPRRCQTSMRASSTSSITDTSSDWRHPCTRRSNKQSRWMSPRCQSSPCTDPRHRSVGKDDFSRVMSCRTANIDRSQPLE